MKRRRTGRRRFATFFLVDPLPGAESPWLAGRRRRWRLETAFVTRHSSLATRHSPFAEGAERPDRQFRQFLTIALGSNAEVEAQATIAADLGCIDQATATRIIDCTDYIGRMINRLQQTLSAPD